MRPATLHANTPTGVLTRDVDLDEAGGIPETLTFEEHPTEIWLLRAKVSHGGRVDLYYARADETLRLNVGDSATPFVVRPGDKVALNVKPRSKVEVIP